MFLWNVLIALLWAVLNGRFDMPILLLGFALGYICLGIVGQFAGKPGYLSRLVRVANLLVFFLWELLMANLRVAYEVITPRHRMKPGIVAVPLDVSTDAEILILANLITLTPGTLSLSVSSDRRVLYVHTMDIGRGPDQVVRRIKAGLEQRLMGAMR